MEDLHIRNLKIQLKVAQAIRMLHSAGVMDQNGHLSSRDDNVPNEIWINSKVATRSSVGVRDIVPVDLRTGQRIGEGDDPPKELPIHISIFRRRPDVGAIVHCHPKWINVLSIAGEPLRPVTPASTFLPTEVPVVDYVNSINTMELGDEVAKALGSSPIVVLSNHGVVVVGSTVEEVFARAAYAEENAQQQYHASLLRQPRYITGETLENVRREFWVQANIDKFWSYQEEQCNQRGGFRGLEVGR